MAFPGQVLDNPVSGERFIFSKTAADTGGELLAVEFVVAPEGRVPGAHVHPVQEESFEVVSGTMRFKRGRETVLADPGDTVVVPPGIAHRFANAGEGPAVVRVEVRRRCGWSSSGRPWWPWPPRAGPSGPGCPGPSTSPCSCGSSSRKCGHHSLPAWHARPPRRWRGWPRGAALPAAIRHPDSGTRHQRGSPPPPVPARAGGIPRAQLRCARSVRASAETRPATQSAGRRSLRSAA